jgi:hypothetical protein
MRRAMCLFSNLPKIYRTSIAPPKRPLISVVLSDRFLFSSSLIHTALVLLVFWYCSSSCILVSTGIGMPRRAGGKSLRRMGMLDF